jgi:hypothetical protein
MAGPCGQRGRVGDGECNDDVGVEMGERRGKGENEVDD